MFDMLSNALSDKHERERASITPSHASSSAGPFKVNSMKMNHKETSLDDKQSIQDFPQNRQRFVKAASYNARDTRHSGHLVLPKAISLPNDRGLHGTGRRGRFTLEGVKEEQPSTFQAPYPQPEATPETNAPATESPAPRRWSLLRMFAMQKKETTPPPVPESDQLSQTGQQQVADRPSNHDAERDRSLDLGNLRPSFNQRHASSMSRRTTQNLPHGSRRASSAMCDTAASVHSGQHGQVKGPFIPGAYPGTASSTGTTWQTPQADLHTPSAYITPVPLNVMRQGHAERSREMLQAAQQATPEQARAMLQKFSSIRAQQRRHSQVTGY